MKDWIDKVNILYMTRIPKNMTCILFSNYII